MKEKLKFTKSCGSIFKDLACENADENYLRASMCMVINFIINSNGFSYSDFEKDVRKNLKISKKQLDGICCFHTSAPINDLIIVAGRAATIHPLIEQEKLNEKK